jgi:MFS family permease
VAFAAYLADHLATRAFGVAFGAVTLAFGGGQVAGPQLGGWIAEATGSFTPPFLLSSGIAAAGAAGALHLHLGDRRRSNDSRSRSVENLQSEADR